MPPCIRTKPDPPNRFSSSAIGSPWRGSRVFDTFGEKRVVLITPVSNPDGRDKQVEWFYRFLKGKTDRDPLPRQAPPYWSKYAFVDINRDAHQLVHEAT